MAKGSGSGIVRCFAARNLQGIISSQKTPNTIDEIAVTTIGNRKTVYSDVEPVVACHAVVMKIQFVSVCQDYRPVDPKCSESEATRIMSPKPALSRPVPAPKRVSGGIPWWLWLILVIFGVFVVTTLVKKAIPEDPRMYVQEGMVAIEKGDAVAIERSVQNLKKFPEYAAEQKLLEGMLNLGKSKPLLAIPFLQDASKEPKIRIKALTQLGNAYLRSRQRAECIAAYETILQEDESVDDVRLSLAYVLKDMISWDESLKHLMTLRERKFRLGLVHQLIADINSDTDQYAEAATEYEASLIADPNDPTNSNKVYRLVMCRIETGNLNGIEEFLSVLDSEGVRDSARALVQLEKGQTEQAIATLDIALKVVPYDATANLTYGRIMAGIGSKEKAIEALTNLQKPLRIHSRNSKLFEIVVKLATIAGEEKLAVAAQQNVDQLKELELNFSAKLREVVKTRDDAQARIELGDLATATGRSELARSIYRSVSFIDSTLEPSIDKKIQSLQSGQLFLVPLSDTGSSFEIETPVQPTPEPASGLQKAATPEQDALEVSE